MKIHVRTVGPFQENCYLVVDEATNRAVLVDPGDEPGVILDMIAESGATLDAIWVTHAHLDHIGAIAEVTRHHDVPVYVHPLDLPLFTTLSARSADVYGVPWDQPSPPERTLAEGDVVECGGLRFTVMHVPGHAPGHVAFIGEGIALSGDLVFAGSIGRTDLPLADPRAMDASIERFAALPGETTVHPGHGPLTTVDEERESNPFLAGRARTLKR